MSILQFVYESYVRKENLFDHLTDFENLKNFFPEQIQEIKILRNSDDLIITREEFRFSTYVKNNIIQESRHLLSKPDKIKTEIIQGPAKGTIIEICLKEKNEKTEVKFHIDLKLSLKAKFFSPLIKKLYKNYLHSIMNKINTLEMS